MLSNADGELWRLLRTVISPTFSTGKLKLVCLHLTMLHLLDFEVLPSKSDPYPVADPGFLRRLAPTPKVEPQPIIWPNFPRKLHE